MKSDHNNTTNPIIRRSVVSLAYSTATKILVMNQKGGVGKSTVIAALTSNLLRLGYRVELIDFDKQQSSHDWAKGVNQFYSQSYNPSLRSFSSIASMLKVHQDTEFVIIDSPSNFTKEDMARYTYFVNAVVIPMQPSPIDLHASLPFIRTVLESGILNRRKISLSFIINRCTNGDTRIENVNKLLQNFRQFPVLGRMSESEHYQTAFYYKKLVSNSIDRELWDNTVKWLCKSHNIRTNK